MISLTQYITEAFNIDKYYDEYGERKDHNYSLHKLKKGDPIYLVKGRNAENIVELTVSKIESGKNTDKGAWWATQYKCKVYVDKNDEGIEYFFATNKSENGPFTGWWNTSVYVLRVGTMFTDKRTDEYGSFYFSDIALDKEDIEDRYGELSPEIKAELKKRREGWPEKYINKTLEEFKKYESKKPDEVFNITVNKFVRWLKQGQFQLDEYREIENMVTYCFENNWKDFNKFLRINGKREIEIKQYNVSEDECILLLYIENYPLYIDSIVNDDDYTNIYSLKSYLETRKK